MRHSRLLEWFYAQFADVFLMLHPLWKAIGYARAEGPVKFIEKRVKGFLFDCRMCGQCVLSSTGMSCPMNCPKQLAQRPLRRRARQRQLRGRARHALRLGQGLGRLAQHGKGDAILNVQKPVDQSLRETSAWLRVTAQAAAEREKAEAKPA